MTTLSYCPELMVNGSTLKLGIKLAAVKSMRNMASVEYRFEVDCCLWHPTGTFTYSVSDLCFDIAAFERFAHELREFQEGRRQDAALRNVGDMMVFKIEGNSRNVMATLNIREYLAPAMATLDAKVEVDYDLFINRLPGEIEGFVNEIRLIEPPELD